MTTEGGEVGQSPALGHSGAVAHPPAEIRLVLVACNWSVQPGDVFTTRSALNRLKWQLVNVLGDRP